MWAKSSKQISPESIPLAFPGQVDFDLRQFATHLSELLEQPVQLINHSPLMPATSPPAEANSLSLQLSPLPGSIQLWLEKTVKEDILGLFLGPHKVKSSIKDSFWTFLMSKVLRCVSMSPALESFTPQLRDGRAKMSLEGAGQVDLVVKVADLQFALTLMLDAVFLDNFKRHCLKNRQLSKSSSLAKQKQLIKMSARVGSVKVPCSLLKSLSKGDWLVLDHGNFENETPLQAELFWGKKKIGKADLLSGELNLTHIDLS